MFTTLVDADTLASHMDDPQWIVCDCRHDLTDYHSGRRAYDQAHIPGAIHLPTADLSELMRERNTRIRDASIWVCRLVLYLGLMMGCGGAFFAAFIAGRRLYLISDFLAGTHRCKCLWRSRS